MIGFVNNVVELSCKLDDREDSLYPLAVIYKSDNSVVASYGLSSVASGVYTTRQWIPTTPGYFKIDYNVYSDSSYTTLSEDYNSASELYFITNEYSYQSTLNAVKSQTDKLQFDANSYIKSNVQDKGVLNDPSVVDIDNQLSSTHGSGSWETGSGGSTAAEIADAVWDEPISEHTTAGSFGAKNQRVVPSESVDDYKADISNLALESTTQSIKSQTDKMQFDVNNYLKVNVQDKGVLNDVSVSEIDSQLTSSHGSGNWTTADISGLALETTVQSIKSQTDKLQFDTNNYVKSNIQDKGVLNDPSVVDIDNQLSSTHGSGSWESADVSGLALESSVQSIKSQTDKLQFDSNDYIKANVQDKGVLNDVSASEIDTQLSNSHGSGSWQTADVTNLAQESTVQSIKTQTDKLQFNASNDVKATLDGEPVNLTNDTETQIDDIDTIVRDISGNVSYIISNFAYSSQIPNDLDKVPTSGELALLHGDGSWTTADLTDISNEIDYISSQVTYISSQVSGGTGLTASDVWNYSSRTLTSGTRDSSIDYISSQVTWISSQVSGGTNLTASEVWSYSNRTLTAGTRDSSIDYISSQVGYISSQVSGGTNLTASEVWSYGDRTLTTGTRDSSIDYISSQVAYISSNLKYSGGGGSTYVYTRGKSPWTREKVKQVLDDLKEIKDKLAEVGRKLDEHSELNDALATSCKQSVLDTVTKSIGLIGNLSDITKEQYEELKKNLQKLSTDINHLDTKEDIELLKHELEDIMSLVVKLLPDEELDRLNGYEA